MRDRTLGAPPGVYSSLVAGMHGQRFGSSHVLSRKSRLFSFPFTHGRGRGVRESECRKPIRHPRAGDTIAIRPGNGSALRINTRPGAILGAITRNHFVRDTQLLYASRCVYLTRQAGNVRGTRRDYTVGSRRANNTLSRVEQILRASNRRKT